MPPVQQAIDDFLAQKRIAVAGVSREGGNHAANGIYLRLKERGYTVFPVNPNADKVEGDPCFHDLKSIPGGVDAVVVGTHPKDSANVVQQCNELGIKHIWMHSNFSQGSYSKDAHEVCRANGIAAITGGCPLMYGPTSDGFHRFMRSILGVFGKLPKEA
jgi:predicted CoA-binding protein